MEWLHPFIALTLCCGVVLTLLPEGTLRRTAALTLGLMMMLCWADSLTDLLHLPQFSSPAATVLEETGASIHTALEEYIAALHPTGGE